MTNPPLTIEAKLQFLATTGAAISQLMGRPETAPLGAELISDLRAYRAQYIAPDELATGREILREQGARFAAAAAERMKVEGPRLWRKWHLRALEHDPSGQILSLGAKQEMDWITREITNQLPCGECKAHFKDLVREYFPDGFHRYFETTVEIHNRVNARLGKPEVTPDEARALLGIEGVQTSG